MMESGVEVVLGQSGSQGDLLALGRGLYAGVLCPPSPGKLSR
jgi:hypothetical protein